MGGEAESRDGSAGHSQSSEPDLAAGAAVELRPTEEEVPATWMLTPAQPVFRDGNYGGSFCELLVAETIQEYLKFHGLQETHRALADALSKSGLPAAFGASAVELPSEPKGHAVQVELAVLQALRAFDEGQQEAFFQRWRALVPPSPTGSSLELQLYVYFGTYPTRKVLAEKDPSLPLPTADWTELKSFLASRPTWPTEANSSLSSLYALPFVPQAHQNSLLRFIFEESWSEKLRSDVQAFMTAYTSTRHAPSLRHLAGAIIVSKTPPSCPPAHSWHELLRIADLGWASAATALKQQAFENMPSDQPEAKPELLNWLSTGGGKILPDLRKQVFELRGRLGALARHPDEPPVAPSRVQETQRSLRPSIQSLARAPSSAEWEPQGGSSPSGVPVLQDRLWPREVLRGSSASSLGGSHSNAGAVRRLHSARSIESRARTATALLPVPPALDFGRMASQMGGAEEKAPVREEGVADAVKGNLGEQIEGCPDWHCIDDLRR
ncbi:LisH domain-containing protein ARMC9 (Armadillo repeat-containing protein 9) [Durusdinium trenchii]|uniref:LisH domain-containing protein ARMC9 (Armadillo repeat-containing protein 9) n=1 Tax=Durusdinium trenchii TaxID=1381693 RepID=A0ABP0JLT4_9DINO